MNLQRKYKLLLIHHSHTDIGYTEPQERVLAQQVDYIYTILDYLESSAALHSGFKWNCESFVVVEQFLQSASAEDRARFTQQVHSGRIEISASFANFAELLEPAIMGRMVTRATEFGRSIGCPISCGMQADVNGFSQSYAQQLVAQGIKFYFAEVHTHHGMYPVFAKQSPFYWQLADGSRLLVWNGEHYMFGNAFGFADGAIRNYAFANDLIDDDPYNTNQANWLELAEKRLENYLHQLEQDDYPFDFVPVGISGKWTDNAAPHFGIAERVAEWNRLHGEQVEVTMVTLSEFHAQVAACPNLPTYSGDWPDWWTDGVGSAPREVKIFKNIQSKYASLRSIAYNAAIELPGDLCKNIDYDLALFSEHTFGAWSSISNPYDRFAHESWAGKQWYVFNALRNVDRAEMLLLKALGAGRGNNQATVEFQIINPTNLARRELIHLPLPHGDLGFAGNYTISDESGLNYVYNAADSSAPTIVVDLAAGESKRLTLHNHEGVQQKAQGDVRLLFSRYQLGGSDNVVDCHASGVKLPADIAKLRYGFHCSETSVENAYYKISWNAAGICSWWSKELAQELLDGSASAFGPIYEITRTTARNCIGRNRKGIDVERSTAQLVGKEITSQTALWLSLKLSFTLAGCDKVEIVLTLYRDIERVDVKVRLAKRLEILPESIYLALPFVKQRLYLDKKTHLAPAHSDQLPGSLTDFYAAYDGVYFASAEYGVVVSTPDSHLIHVGDLAFRERILFGDPALAQVPTTAYVWLMNNIWETNFISNLADFYEFEYSVSAQTNFADQEQARAYLNASNQKPLVYINKNGA